MRTALASDDAARRRRSDSVSALPCGAVVGFVWRCLRPRFVPLLSSRAVAAEKEASGAELAKLEETLAGEEKAQDSGAVRHPHHRVPPPVAARSPTTPPRVGNILVPRRLIFIQDSTR